MKKLMVLTTAVATTLSLLNGGMIFAEGSSTASQVENESPAPANETSNFMRFSGTITDVDQNENGLTLIMKDQEGSETHLIISDKTLLLDSHSTEYLQKKSLEKGLHIDAYYDKNKPMLLIYPPRISPEIVIVNNKDMGHVKVSKFNHAFVSEDNELQLNFSEDTVLLNQHGESVQKDDLNGKEWIVFYDVSTRSIPAQTTPKKIIALDSGKEMPREIEELIQEDHYAKEGTTMIPIRKIAEQLGYKVEWQPETLGITLSKQNLSFLLKIGEKEFAYNRSVRYLDVIPEIKDGKTYVPEVFLDMLL